MNWIITREGGFYETWLAFYDTSRMPLTRRAADRGSLANLLRDLYLPFAPHRNLLTRNAFRKIEVKPQKEEAKCALRCQKKMLLTFDQTQNLFLPILENWPNIACPKLAVGIAWVSKYFPES